jgi:hypothetical protein
MHPESNPPTNDDEIMQLMVVLCSGMLDGSLKTEEKRHLLRRLRIARGLGPSDNDLDDEGRSS